ncbi:MAG: SDR family oxidoreductase [Clostridium sp.]|nr:SDR family oxidoreductase [Clostridium sp.]MCM1398331.1 SDR family oxidoreductase [Clostridium sp.]MCM1459004.1 SDR family oxidoreductase [Bacteroides sp.]
MTDVKGRWALVTGASRGIGRLAAKYLAKQGCNIIVHSSRLEHSRAVSKEIQALGVSTFEVAANLSDMGQVKNMLEQIDAMKARVDIVLNNAGVQVAYRTRYFETPVSDYEESFLINTIAPMMICYHFLPKMIENGFGRIVNTTSGIRLEPQQAGYSASKAALDKVTVDLGSTVDGTDVMINLTDPGWCRTDLGGNNAPNSPESALPGVVLGVFLDDKKSGRIISAQEYAGLSLDEAVALAGK